jgi:hypothetical protein
MFRCRKRKGAAIPDKSDIRLPDRHVGLGPTTDIDEASGTELFLDEEKIFAAWQ